MIIIITKMVVEYITAEEDRPFGTDAMIIGNLDSNEHSGGLEQKTLAVKLVRNYSIRTRNKYNECVEKSVEDSNLTVRIDKIILQVQAWQVTSLWVRCLYITIRT